MKPAKFSWIKLGLFAILHDLQALSCQCCHFAAPTWLNRRIWLRRALAFLEMATAADVWDPLCFPGLQQLDNRQPVAFESPRRPSKPKQQNLGNLRRRPNVSASGWRCLTSSTNIRQQHDKKQRVMLKASCFFKLSTGDDQG